MIQDVNVKALKKNAFRYSKVRGETASRVRVPGGLVSAKSMARIVEIAEEFGNGEIFLTNRQGVEIPGISLDDMPKVNALLQQVIEDTQINQEDTSQGYLASGTRNVVACPGKRLCPFGCYDTTAFAQRMDHEIFPNNRHVKVAFTGCSNDCAHVALNDFGIIGMTEPQYDPTRCIGCGQCVDWCQRRSVSALRLVNDKVVRDEDRCIGCGVCGVLPHARVDAQPRALLPREDHGPHRQAEPAHGAGLAALGGRGLHREDREEHLRVHRGVHRPQRAGGEGTHRLHSGPRGL